MKLMRKGYLLIFAICFGVLLACGAAGDDNPNGTFELTELKLDNVSYAPCVEGNITFDEYKFHYEGTMGIRWRVIPDKSLIYCTELAADTMWQYAIYEWASEQDDPVDEWIKKRGWASYVNVPVYGTEADDSLPELDAPPEVNEFLDTFLHKSELEHNYETMTEYSIPFDYAWNASGTGVRFYDPTNLPIIENDISGAKMD